MNHIYKSIFNKALGVFTAVPEFASAHGKGSERTVVGRVAKGTAGFAASALAISVGLALTSTSAVAGPGIYINDGKSDDGCLALPDASGPNVGIYGISNAGGGINVSILAPGQVAPNKDYFAMNAMAPCLSSGNAAQALDTQTNRTLFYGNDSYGYGTITNNGAKNLTLGGRLDVNSGIIGVGDRGTNGAGATNSIRMGTGTTLDNANKQINSIAIGVNAGVNTIASIAIGDDTQAGGKGNNDPFNGEAGLAIGHQAQGVGTGAVAIGQNASVKDGHDSVAIGVYSQTTNQKAISIGAYNEARGAQSTVIGSNYDTNSRAGVSIASGTRSQIFGVQSNVSGDNSVSIGDTNTVASARTYVMGNNINVKAGINDALAFGTRASVQVAKSIAMGENATAGLDDGVTTPYVKPSVAIGAETKATGKGSVSIGHEAASLGESATALGIQATAPGKGQTSLGLHAGHSETGDQVNQQYGVFIGRYSGGDNQNPNVATEGGNIYGIAIGESAGRYGQGGSRNTAIGEQAGQYVKGSHNIALGTQAGKGTDTDKLVVNNTTAIGNAAKALTDNSISIGLNSKSGKADAFSGNSSIAIGAAAEAMGTSSMAIGARASTSNGHDSIALGTYATTENQKATAIGSYSAATGRQSLTIANNYDSKNLKPVSVASGARATVIGAETTVSGDNSVAIGDTNNIASARTYAMGNNINVAAGADDSLVFGTRAAVGAANTVAIGANANAAQANSVALGAGSATSAPHTGNYTLNTSYTAAGQPNAANGTVSVGSAGKERQIQNVAAGVISATSTDAINGSQLYATNNYLSNLATGVKNVLGGDAAVNNAGNLTMSNIGGTGKGNVNDAIAAANTKVAAGDNITVTPTTNADGSKTYTVATTKDLVVNSVKAGDTTVNTDGVTIAGGPSVQKTGINAGNKKITGVANGNVAAGSTDAVNGGQLAEVKAKADSAVQNVVSANPTALTATKAGDTVTLTPNVIAGDLVNPATGAVNTPAAGDAGKLVTAGTVANALANTHFVVDTAKTDGELDAASKHDQKIKSGNKVTLQAGKNLKAKQTNAADGATVEFSLKDSISLTQVTAGTGANQVVLGDDGVKVGGNTYINNDGLNANNKPISNVADGVNPKDAVNKGQLDAVKGVADSAVKSVDVANGEQNLVVDNTDPKNPKLSLKKDLTVDSVKAGDSTLNTDGLTIAGGPSVKKDGINAGDKTITNVAPGAVTPTSKDAVNGGQLYNVANNVKDLIGPDATIDPATGKVTVADPVKGIGETGKGNIGDAIKHVNDAAKAAADTAKKHTTVEQGDNIVVEESTNANGGKHYKVSTAKDLNVDSVKAGDTTVNNDGVTIAGGPSVTKGGINAGGNTITNVADGVNPNDAVNKGQLDAVKNVADSAVKSVDVANGEQNLVVDNSDPKNPKLSLKKDLTVDSVKAGDSTLNTDGLTIAGGPSVKKDGIDAADKKITNVAAGDVAENSKDAVNGGQLHNVAKGVADVLGGDAAVDGNGKVTMTNIGETGKGNVNDAIKHVNDLAKNAADTAKKHTTVEQGDNIVVEESTNADGGKHYKVSTAKNLNVDSVKAGDTTVNNDGVTIAGGPSVTKGGINAGGNTITNVADGVNPDDAVNKGQLDKVDTKVSNVAQNVVNVLGGDATVNGNGDITMSNIGDTGKGNVNDAIKAVNDLAKKAAAEKTSVKAKDGRSNVTVTEGVNAAGGHEYTVDVERAVTEAGSDQVTVTSKHDADSNTTTYTVDVSDKTKASLAKADSAVQGLTSKDGNLNFNKDPNGNVEVSFNDNLNVKNVTTDRVQVANGPSMSKDGINAAGKAISNVANGNVAKDSKDAVNGGQLHETAQSVADVIGGGATVKDGKVVAGQNGIGNTGQNTVHGAIAAINQNTANNFNQIRGDLRKMDRDLRGGIAGALATAGLPQAFRPGKSMVAAAASTYRGQSGLAIGVSRISDNGKIILKVTGNTNSRGDFGGTIGAGYQW